VWSPVLVAKSVLVWSDQARAWAAMLAVLGAPSWGRSWLGLGAPMAEAATEVEPALMVVGPVVVVVEEGGQEALVELLAVVEACGRGCKEAEVLESLEAVDSGTCKGWPLVAPHQAWLLLPRPRALLLRLV